MEIFVYNLNKQIKNFTPFWFVLLFTIFTSACGQNRKEKQNPFNFLKAMDRYRSEVTDSLKYLIPVLDSVLESDQKYRYGISNNDQAMREFKSHNKEVRGVDSINFLKVSAILDRYGWLGKKDIGIMGNKAIFFVIQHADYANQEKYLPLLRQAILDKKDDPNQLAMLEDRVNLKKNKNQIYGTQVIYDFQKKKYYLLPIIEPENVIRRRESIGLDSATFQSYLNTFHIIWNVETYKKELPEVKQLMLHLKNN